MSDMTPTQHVSFLASVIKSGEPYTEYVAESVDQLNEIASAAEQLMHGYRGIGPKNADRVIEALKRFQVMARDGSKTDG